MNRSYPRETVEMVPVTIKVNGVQVLTGVSFSVVPEGSRPGSFTAATSLSGKIGPLITGLTAGEHRIFAQITSNPEIPVVDCGTIDIT